MAGLDNIISLVQDETKDEISRILDKAEFRKNEILKCANDEAKMIAQRYDEDTERELLLIKDKAQSGGEAEYKRIILSKKSFVLDNVINDVKKDICNSDDETYFSYIGKLILSNALDGHGCIKMSAKDVARLPSDFEKSINTLLGSDKSISISSDTINTDGGFVIEYDEIKVDCTIDSLINDKIDIIRDRIAKALFS